jgi:hypothetical protein
LDRRLILVALTALATACTSSTEEERPQTKRIALRGTYVHVGDDARISQLVVESESRYRLRAQGCADVPCEEHGSYVVDADQHALRLRTDDDGREYTVAFEVLASRGAEASAPGGVLVQSEPGDGAMIEKDRNLVDGQQNIVDASKYSLVATTVLLDGQSYDNGEMPYCKTGRVFKSGGWTVLYGTNAATAEAKEKALAECNAARCYDDDKRTERAFKCWAENTQRCESTWYGYRCAVYAHGN